MKMLQSCFLLPALSLVFLLLCGSSESQAADAAWCGTADLTLKPLQGTAAGGTSDATYAFQNRSGKSCVLGGFPSLSALDNRRKPIPGVEFKRVPEIWAVAEQPSIPSRIILKPGDQVWFQLVFASENVYHGGIEDRSTCHKVGTLSIKPPGNRTPLAAEFSAEVCNPIRYTPVFLPIPVGASR